jgi:hypothetical protein
LGHILSGISNLKAANKLLISEHSKFVETNNTPKKMNNYQQVEHVYGEPPKKSCRQNYCGWKAVVLYIVLAIVFIVIGVSIAAYGFFVLGKGDVCDVPVITCEGSPPSTQGYYNAKKDFSFGSPFTYLYSANFVNDYGVKFNEPLRANHRQPKDRPIQLLYELYV